MSDAFVDYSAPQFSSYDGPLSEYHYHNNEVGNLLEFLKEVNDKGSVWLTDTLFYFHSMPADGFSTYIICAMGEYVNLALLRKIAVKYHNRRLVLITSMTIEDSYLLAKYKIFNIEHLHTLVPFLNKSRIFSPITNRLYTNSILTQRATPYKTIFTALANRNCENLIYSFDPSELTKDELTVDAVRFNVSSEVSKLFTDGNKRIDNLDQWSLLSEAYSNTMFHWANETIYESDVTPRVYLTEKAFKPIAGKTPFMIIGQMGAHDKIKQLGFRTFEQLLDVSSDTLDDFNRATAITSAMQKVTSKFINENIVEVEDIVEYNYDYFINGFTKHVDNMNEPNINKLIGYLNG